MKPQTARHEKQVGAGAPQLGEPLSFPARCGEKIGGGLPKIWPQ